MNKILFEAVDVSELPDVYKGDSLFYEHSEWLFVLNPMLHVSRYCVPNNNIKKPYWENTELEEVYSVAQWLKPTTLSDLRNDVIKEVAEKIWEAAIDFERDSFFGPVPTKAPNKTEYINSLIK